MHNKSLEKREHMSTWEDTLKELDDALQSMRGTEPLFRGHANDSWSLLPGLGRRPLKEVENPLYYDFTSKGHHLLGRPENTWHSLFLMQHHGVPTRLLDWSSSFAVALYFALKGAMTDCAVWVLDPYQLNQETIGVFGLCYLPIDFPPGYEKYFVDSHNPHGHFGTFPAPAVALGADATTPRILAQQGYFTLHRDLDVPLNEVCSSALKKVGVPQSAHKDARHFLRLAGMNEYSLFPDMDGLARHLVAEMK